ncbi:phage holin family protein [Sediminitomix flava]|uniref:Putative membrane protein n=1 Tax=Sediminitomix flava TaxID=379075 RepID=A0A315ZBS1_SEDFL|nr:phage holin family protein [Sediminitomix flava]PWJ42609.1 putative membrane protein [Sediminitomix flava]
MIAKYLASGLAVYAGAWLMDYFNWGVSIDNYWTALIAAIIIGFLNAIVKPILTILTIPVTILTFGLFLIFINTLMFYWTGSLVDGFDVQSMWAALGFSIFYSIAQGFIFDAFGIKENN